ncbi:MAG: hypothetical protein ACOX5R_04285 [bacterium]
MWKFSSTKHNVYRRIIFPPPAWGARLLLLRRSDITGGCQGFHNRRDRCACRFDGTNRFRTPKENNLLPMKQHPWSLQQPAREKAQNRSNLSMIVVFPIGPLSKRRLRRAQRLIF